MHFPESHKVEDDDDKRINASLHLQIISGKYINTLHELIDYTYKGETLTIIEQVKQKVNHAKSVEVNELFPTPAVMDNVYYVTGFLGNQANNEATRRAKDSGVRLCLEHIAREKFLVRNRGQEVGVNALIADKDMPTTMVRQRENFGGLCYATKECWKFFAIIEYVYAELAVQENFLYRGGMLLSEISDGILGNEVVCQLFSSLCGFTEQSKFTFASLTWAPLWIGWIR